MKVVISKPVLYVHVSKPKNTNLARTTQDMKKSKSGFCRMSSALSCHVKSLVNTCWPKMWKFGLKLKKSLKNAFLRRCGQNDGAFRQFGFCEYDIFFQTLPRDLFSPKSNHIIISWKFMKKYFFENLAFFNFSAISTKMLTFLFWRIIWHFEMWGRLFSKTGETFFF